MISNVTILSYETWIYFSKAKNCWHILFLTLGRYIKAGSQCERTFCLLVRHTQPMVSGVATWNFDREASMWAVLFMRLCPHWNSSLEPVTMCDLVQRNQGQ